MVKSHLPVPIFACNGSFGFIRCFNLVLKLCNITLQYDVYGAF